MEAEALIRAVSSWAKRDDRVLAAAVCGSHARGDAGSGSDIDICIVSSLPESLLKDLSWLRLLGQSPSMVGSTEDYGLVTSLRVFYGKTDVELAIAGQVWMDLPIDHETARVMSDGLRILYDPQGRLQKAVSFAARVTE